jgi:hypothetical protein
LSEFYVVPIMREVEAQHLYREWLAPTNTQ